jgi:LacI family transcriptional regulator
MIRTRTGFELGQRCAMVAVLAGVWVATVSRVVRSESIVSEALRAKVLRATAQLDYLPSLTASNLRRSTRQTSTVGLLVANMANPFSSALHRAIDDVAEARGRPQLPGDPASRRLPVNAEILATTYFPERLPSQYLRRWRA